LATLQGARRPTATGRIIAAWASFSLIAAYELLMRQVRRVAEMSRESRRETGSASTATDAISRRITSRGMPSGR
jgi:hypothetical protein